MEAKMSSTRKIKCGESTLYSTTSQLFSSLSLNEMTWSHVELGAANYGPHLTADASNPCKKMGANQHKLLFDTVDNLILQKGQNGLIYINDLEKRNVSFTIYKLKIYLMKKYPNNKIFLMPLVGDFFEIDIPKVDSIHLKNPEDWFFFNLDDEDKKNRLAYFSERAREGLTLVTYFKTHFLYRLEQLGVGYKLINEDYQPYLHIDGNAVRQHGNVVEFLVMSLNSLSMMANKKEFVTKTSYSKSKALNINDDFDMQGFHDKCDKFVPPREDENFEYSFRASTKKLRYR